MKKWILALMACAAACSSAIAAYDSCVLVDDGTGNDWASDEPATHCIRQIDEITGLEFHHLMRDGTRGTEHENVIFLKRLESTSTRFWDAYNNDQVLTRVTFSFFAPDPVGGGALIVHHQVILERVRVIDIEVIDIEPTDGSPRLPVRERIRLEYGTISIDVGGQVTTLSNPAGPRI